MPSTHENVPPKKGTGSVASINPCTPNTARGDGACPLFPSRRPGPRRRAARRASPWRKAVESTVLLLVAWLVCRTWLVEGLVVPLGIPSGSMAEALVGPHCWFVCPDCEQPFACDADVPAPGQWRVCPRCGNVTRNELPLDVCRGDRVLLLRSAFCWRNPRRWEIVAFRDPGRPSRLTVKRVVGLPGESVQIRHGDVYIDGQIARKSLDTQFTMAVLVDDASVKTTKHGAAKPSWRPHSAESRWIAMHDGFVYPESQKGTGSVALNKHGPANTASGDGACPLFRPDSVDWLVFHPRRWVGGSPVAGPVTDELSYNQWRTQRSDEIRPVADLLLRFRAVVTSGDGWLVVQATGGRNHLEAWFRPTTGQCEFRFDGEPIRRGQVPVEKANQDMEVTFSLVDRQLRVALDGRPALGRLLLPSDCPWHASPHPLAVGSAGLGVEISKLRVFRDVYYTRPTGMLARWGFDRPVRLGPQEYYVLGDNSPISDDSRSWPDGAGVPEALLVGKPLVVPIP